MAKPKGPSISQDSAERAAKPVSRASLSPLTLALALSLAAHIAIAATLFARPAEPPKPRSIIAVEIVAGPPGRDARRTADLAAAPGAGAKPRPSETTEAPDPKPTKSEPAKSEPETAKPEASKPETSKTAKTRQVADATANPEPPADKPAEAATPKPPAAAKQPPKSEAPPVAPLPPPAAALKAAAPKTAARAGPRAPNKPAPKAETKPPKTRSDLPAPEAPASKAEPAPPAPAPQSLARTEPTASPRTDPAAAPDTDRIAVRPAPKPKRAEAKRATPPAKPQRHTARAPTKKTASRRQARRTTSKPDAQRQTASAPAGVYVPPRRGRGSGRNRPPVYPRRAQREGWQGRVLLFVQVAANGQVSAVQVRRSSGHGILDRAAVRAVRGWHFEPAKRSGSPVAGSLVVPVRFRLTN